MGQRLPYTYPTFRDLNHSLSCFSFGTQAYPAPLTPTINDGNEFGVLQDAEKFPSLNTQSVLYPATKSPVRLTLESFRVEPAVTGLDWPFTTIPKSEECFVEQQPCGPPSLVRATSTCPGIDRPASGFNAVTKGPIKTLPHTKKLREIGFPSNTKLNSLSSPQQRTPWPVFQDGQHNPSPPIIHTTASPLPLYNKHHSFQAMFGYHYLVSDSFHPPIGVLFSIPSQY